MFEYVCPYKTGSGMHVSVLPATFVNSPYEDEHWVQITPSVSRLGIKTSGSRRKYIDNTIKYGEPANAAWLKRIAEREKMAEEDNTINNDIAFWQGYSLQCIATMRADEHGWTLYLD